MKQMSSVKKSIITAVCIALCVVLAQVLNAIPGGGEVYCPTHIPVLLCGLVCSWQYGLLCGIAGPLLSCLVTGSPAIVLLPALVTECAVYGVITGVMMKFVRTNKTYSDLYISLITAMVTGRIFGGGVKALIFAAGSYSLEAWMAGYFVVSLPALIAQLTLIPGTVMALMKARLIPPRYPADE